MGQGYPRSARRHRRCRSSIYNRRREEGRYKLCSHPRLRSNHNQRHMQNRHGLHSTNPVTENIRSVL